MNEKLYCLVTAMFAIVLLAGLSHGNTQVSATRVLPEFVDPDTMFQVAINIDVDESNAPPNYILSEKIPEGFRLGSVDPSYDIFDEEKRMIKWVVIGGFEGKTVVDQTYTYTLDGSDPGSYAFNGVLGVGSESFTTEGNIVVKVRDNCTENWVCGYWSECVGGEQTRTCEDKSGCLFPVNAPEMSRPCTEEEETVQEEDDTPEIQDVEDDTQEQPGEAEEETGTGTGESQGDAAEDQSGEEEDPVGEMTSESEQETGEEETTGQATAVIDEQNQTEVLTEDDVDAEPPEDINKVPLFTKVLCFILVAEVIVLALKKS